MKKFTFLLAGILACTVSLNAQTWPPAGMNGIGDSSNPYEITTPEQLIALANYVNAGNGTATAGEYYKLMNNVDFSSFGTAVWNPIGNYASSNNIFQGNFDGNDNVVKNLGIDRTSNYIGFFGRTAGATIKNLGMENCNIKGASTSSSSYVGGLVGYNDNSNITNCYVSGSVSSTTSTATAYSSYAGGLVGYNFSGSITNCYASGAVSSTTTTTAYSSYAGGLVGWNENPSAVIRNCVAANNSVKSAANNSSNAYANRVTGHNNGTLQNNYANAAMLVQNNGSNVSQNSNLNEATGANANITTLQTRAFYTTASNWYSGAWNFTNVWNICEEKTFPWFSSQWEDIDCEFVSVTNITGVATNINRNKPLKLECTIVPSNATNQDIIWSIQSAGSTGASISGGNILKTTAATSGTIRVRATIKNGSSVGPDNITIFYTDYTQDFNITAEMFCDGDGTSTKPYQICDIEELTALANYVNNANSSNTTAGKYYKLMNDIELSGLGSSVWNPIGNYAASNNVFQGNFDGNGKVVKNLSIDRTSNYIGFFGRTAGATIKNLGIENCNITRSSVAATAYTGALVGYNDNSNITNCYVSGTISSNASSVYPSYSGGLVGYNDNSNITNCYASATVSSNASSSYSGGLVGYNDNSNITNCYASGAISSNATDYSSYAGGLVGRNFWGSVITNCYASNTVSSISSSSDSYSGGLVGDNYSSSSIIKNCVAANTSVTSSGNSSDYTNRITGYNGSSNTAQNNYANTSMTVRNNGNNVSQNPNLNGITGANANIATLQTRAFYTTATNWNSGAWNFTNVWNICENSKFPWLQWEGINCTNIDIANVMAEASGIVVYPNPTTGQLTVKCAETLRATSVQMFDVVGKVVGTYSISPENTGTVIDVSQLQPGVYVLKIGNYTGRFVKE